MQSDGPVTSMLKSDEEKYLGVEEKQGWRKITKIECNLVFKFKFKLALLLNVTIVIYNQ